MELLKNTVNEVMLKLGGKTGPLSQGDPQEWLKNALTKKELRHIKVKYFSKGILGLSVDSSAWLYNLNLKRDSLLEVLQKQHPGLKKINFRIGEI